jgi:DNA polymerase I-like protein with 3'-5' exonuclease and polymerase domains
MSKAKLPPPLIPTSKRPDPRTISLDIETYGITRFTPAGRLLPDQTVFHPARSVSVDGCPIRELVQTVSVTVADHDGDLAHLAPGPTFVFQLHVTAHRKHLARWLAHAHTILGMNLQFDLLYLRSQPDLRFHLSHQILIDLSVLNYLHSELRPERSLKALGPILGTHAYPKEQLDRDKRYHDARSPELHRYNAADTHNTLLACAELARRIHHDYPGTDKLSPECITHYSDTIWTVVRMSEAGVPMDRAGLLQHEQDVVSRMRELEGSASDLGLILTGKGSAASKLALMQSTCAWIEEHHDPNIRSHPLFQLTEAKREIAVNDVNRQLFLSFAPPTDLAAPLTLLGEYSSLQKLLSSYFFPLLRHQRMNPANRSSTLVPRPNSPVGVSYPTWFVTPTASKDGAGGEGGTLQGRITCKNFRHQTDPDEIKQYYRSRWPRGHIVGYDLSQIEMVVAGLLSGDEALCSAFCAEPPLDLHTSRATQVFGPDITQDPDFKKVYRQAAKGANFGDLFRAGAPTLQTKVFKMTGVVVPMKICENIVKTRAQSRPGLWAWQEKLIRETRAAGYVVLPFIGQSRRFMGGDAYDISEIVNMPIQCTAGNVLLRIQHYLHHSLPSINAPAPDILMFLNVYDAIYFDVRNDAAVDRLDTLFRDAFDHVTTVGYWARLCEKYGRHIPIRYERTIYS